MLPRTFDPVLLPRLVIWALVVGLLTYTVADPDLWGHVRFGQDILAARAIPAIDPYSFTSDRPWVNHEWLSETVMAAAFAAGRALGLSILKLALLLIAVFIIARELAARGVPPIARDLLVAVCVVSCMTLTRTVRPQTFSIALFAVFLASLRRVEDGRVALLLILPPLMALWANLHGGWLVGIGVLGIWTAVRVIAPCGASRAQWAAAGVGSLLASLATPEGTAMWVFLYETVGLGRADIGEWQSLLNRAPGDALPWVLTTVVVTVALVRGREWRVSHVAAVALLLFTSFKVWRLTPFYAVAGILLLGPLTVRPAARAIRPSPPAAAGALALVGLMMLLAVSAAGVTGYRNLTCIRMTGDWIADREAAAFIGQAGLNGRMLTWFDWGEYAIWFLSPAVKVSMDGRRETVYTDRMLDLHLSIYRGQPGWRDALNQINPDHVWLPTTVPTLREIEGLGFRRIFRTAQSEILTRADVPAPPAVPSLQSTLEPCFPGRP